MKIILIILLSFLANFSSTSLKEDKHIKNSKYEGPANALLLSNIGDQTSADQETNEIHSIKTRIMESLNKCFEKINIASLAIMQELNFHFERKLHSFFSEQSLQTLAQSQVGYELYQPPMIRNETIYQLFQPVSDANALPSNA